MSDQGCEHNAGFPCSFCADAERKEQLPEHACYYSDDICISCGRTWSTELMMLRADLAQVEDLLAAAVQDFNNERAEVERLRAALRRIVEAGMPYSHIRQAFFPNSHYFCAEDNGCGPETGTITYTEGTCEPLAFTVCAYCWRPIQGEGE